MRELSFSEFPCIAGGVDFDNEVISLFGMVSSLAGYEFSTNVMQTLGFSDGMTEIGTFVAAFGGGSITLSLWNNPNNAAGDRIYAGMTLSFLYGACVGITVGDHQLPSRPHP